ncbi:helix-turn-helix domain-containing protein [Thalassobaculum litoreum]|uniref:helix-turn-helix domain-containing protein n=1 Tax=Thalassobaculum litoreum TaxID=420996 RepID=UPI000B8568C6|nr:helix-turn-helix domain-containing protein [Thalassobaculum litoreum]
MNDDDIFPANHSWGGLSDRPLHESFKLAREAKGYSKAYLSKLTGISQNSLMKYENGDAEPPLKNAVVIAQALEIDPRRLFDRVWYVHKMGKDENKQEESYYSFTRHWRRVDDADRENNQFKDPRFREVLSLLKEIDEEHDAIIDHQEHYYNQWAYYAGLVYNPDELNSFLKENGDSPEARYFRNSSRNKKEEDNCD